MVWLAWFWPGGAYRNGGLGSAVALLLWPVLLCLASGIVLWICRTGR